MSFAYFISENYLKENTPIDDNVDIKLLKTAMRESQDIYIRDIIGSGIYNELITQINASTLTVLNTTLLNEYIKPCQKYYVLYETAPMLSFQIVNKGIQTRNSEHSNPADISVVTQLASTWKDKGEYYANRLRDYLQQNRTSYPLYMTPGTALDTIYPNDGAFYGGFFFDKGSNGKKFMDKP